jgi:RNA polymerase sigma-70 factor, ECF subfamily
MSLSLFNRKKKELKSEQDLVNSAKKDSSCFAPLYEKYHEQIFRFVYQRMSNEADAADLTSVVFLKVLLNLNKYQDKGFPFSSWLYKIALNEVNQFYRKTKKQRSVNIDEHDIEDIIEETNDKYSNEKREKLLQILATLSEDKLSLIEMRFFEKRAFKEIAEVLNITENNAKVRTYRVLEEMKKNML